MKAKRKKLFGYVNEMRRRKERVGILQNEGEVKLQPSSVGIQNKSGACLPFLMMWMMTRASEGQRQSDTPGAEAQPQPQVCSTSGSRGSGSPLEVQSGFTCPGPGAEMIPKWPKTD